MADGRRADLAGASGGLYPAEHARNRLTLLAFLGSAGDGAALESGHVKQFTAPLESGVENWDEMADYLTRAQQMNLLPAKAG